MKLNYDGLSVTFTPDTEDDSLLLKGFANLDAVTDNFTESNSYERLHAMNKDFTELEPEETIVLLSQRISDDSTFDEGPPEDEDEDDTPTPVPGMGL